MKNLMVFAVCALFVFVQGCASITTVSEPRQEVVDVHGTDQETLYVRANNWAVDTFRNADSVIQFNDRESGTISGRYLLGTIAAASDYGPTRYAYAAIRVNLRDNAARIVVTPESFTYAQGNPYTLYTEEDMERDVAAIIEEFSQAMAIPEDDDW